MTLDASNRALLATVFVLVALLAARLGQQALITPPGFEAAVDPADVHSILIGTRSRSLTLQRVGDGWILIQSDESLGPADPAAVARLLDAWRHFSTRYMVASEARAADLAEIGIEHDTVVMLRLDDARGETLLAMEIGGQLPSGDRYLRRQDDRAVYVGPADVGDLLTAESGRWLDASGLDAAADRVVRFGLRNRHGELALERSGATWTRIGGAPVRSRATSQLVRAAMELFRAREVDPAEAAAAGDAARQPRVSLWWEEPGQPRRAVHLAGDAPAGQVYMHRDTATVFLVGAEELSRFDIDASALAP